MKNYYLVTTEHLEEALWFRDDGDYATGMNYVAEALRQIRFRFSAGVHQAARVCGISYAEAANLLDTSC